LRDTYPEHGRKHERIRKPTTRVDGQMGLYSGPAGHQEGAVLMPARTKQGGKKEGCSPGRRSQSPEIAQMVWSSKQFFTTGAWCLDSILRAMEEKIKQERTMTTCDFQKLLSLAMTWKAGGTAAEVQRADEEWLK
jgi:hypothetical protein